MAARRPRAPELGPAGRQFWRSVVAAYELSPAETETLRQACHTVEPVAWAQEEVEGAPLTVAGSATGQTVAHSLLGTLTDLRRVLDQQITSLALPMPDEVEGRRRSPKAIAAAQQRWRAQKQRGA